MKDQSKVSQQKDNQEHKGHENTRSPEGIRSFAPPSGIPPVAVQMKPNIIQRLQSLPLHQRPPRLQPNPIQRMQSLPEEQRPEKLKPNTIQTIQRKRAEEEKVLQKKSGTANKMPAEVQSKMEGAFGADFSNVNIHQGSDAGSVGALAYTQGDNIHFAPGQFNPQSQKGQELLGHELSHVVQQREGRVQSTTQAKGLPVNDDESLEKEADEMGMKAAQFKSADASLPPGKKESSASDVIQKATETPANYKNYTQLLAMTCFELDEYANVQADWHSGSTLTDPQRYWIRSILEFLRADSNLAPCGALKVEPIKDKMIAEGEAKVKTNLAAYCKSVSDSVPFEYTSTSSLSKAFLVGANMIKLKSNFPDFVLASAFNEEAFNFLMANAWVDDLIAYYTTSLPKPIFEAEDAMDVKSYTDMRSIDKVNPLTFNSAPLTNNIRNYHRFEKPALDTLKVNYNDVSKTKPLTLILHSALDHNGAFHRDFNLTEVIQKPAINTLMIEGKETLDEVKSQITPLAKKYGKNDKIDQVMFAGHGNARSIQLAGTIKNTGGKVEEVNDSINLNGNKVKSDEVFDELLKNIDDSATAPADKQKHRTLVFNACLTNSNQVNPAASTGLTKTDEIKKAFLANIKTTGSLTTYLQDKANTLNKDLKVKGSNASFGQIGLIDKGTNALDLISTDDPKLTASKLVYMEFGTEPTGALRAAVESWATDEKTCFEAMARRIAKKTNKWDDVIITKAYEIILAKYKADGPNINKFTIFSYYLSHASIEDQCRPAFLSALDGGGADMIDMFKALSAADRFTSSKFIPLVMYQNWMTLDAANAGLKTSFLNHLEANYNCHSAKKFVDIDYLDKKGHMTDLLSGAASPGKLILALLGVNKSNQADCKKYVISQVNATDTFDAALKVNSLLGGISTENEILIKIGKKTAPSSVSVSSAPASKNANLVPMGETKNKVYVDSVSKKGKISKVPEAETFTLPDKTSKKLDNVTKDTDVFIIGSADSFWAIEYKTKDAIPKAGTVFVEKADITLS
jgi:hypothetical protein